MMLENDAFLIDYDAIDNFEIKCLQNMLAKVAADFSILDIKEDIDKYTTLSDIAVALSGQVSNIRNNYYSYEDEE